MQIDEAIRSLSQLNRIEARMSDGIFTDDDLEAAHAAARCLLEFTKTLDGKAYCSLTIHELRTSFLEAINGNKERFERIAEAFLNHFDEENRKGFLNGRR